MTTPDRVPVGEGGPLVGPWSRLDLLRVVCLAAIALSIGLLVEGLLPEPLLCGFDSDCHRVTHSPFARPGGIPLPAVGVLGFGVLFGSSLAPQTRAGRLLAPLALLAGAAGAALIGVQGFVLGHYCPYCLAVDALAVVAGCLVVTRRRAEVAPAVGGRVRVLWAATAVLATATALSTIGLRAGGDGLGKVAVPPRIAAMWVPVRVTLVEIYDFQCPHCRRLEPVVRRFLAEEGDRVHHVRLTVPMPAHRQARPASRAFLCAEAQGRGPEMADRLIASPALAPSACERIASALGLSLPEYRACVADPATDARLDADLAWVKEAHPGGLPVIWVQDQALSGLRPESALDTLRAAVRTARERPGESDRSARGE